MRISTKFAGQLLIFTAFAATLYDVDAMQTVATKDPDSLKKQCVLFIAKNYDKFQESIKSNQVPNDVMECILGARINAIDQDSEKRKKQLTQIANDILECGTRVALESEIIEFLCKNYFELKKNEKKQFYELFHPQFIQRNDSTLRNSLNNLHYKEILSHIILNIGRIEYENLKDKFMDYTNEIKQSKNGLIKIMVGSDFPCYELYFKDRKICSYGTIAGSLGFDFISNDSAVCVKTINDTVIVDPIPWQFLKNNFTIEQNCFLVELYTVYNASLTMQLSFNSEVDEQLGKFWNQIQHTFESVEQASINNILTKIKSKLN